MKKWWILVIMAMALLPMAYAEEAQDFGCEASAIVEALANAQGIDAGTFQAGMEYNPANNSMQRTYGEYTHGIYINPVTRKVCAISITGKLPEDNTLLLKLPDFLKMWHAALAEIGLEDAYAKARDKLGAEADNLVDVITNYMANSSEKTTYVDGCTFIFQTAGNQYGLFAGVENANQIMDAAEHNIGEGTARALLDKMIEVGALNYRAANDGQGSFFSAGTAETTRDAISFIQANCAERDITAENQAEYTGSITVYANESTAINTENDNASSAYFNADRGTLQFRYKNVILRCPATDTATQGKIIGALMQAWDETF